eukprot:PhM_4_TR11626/c4_g1_i5/m.57177
MFRPISQDDIDVPCPPTQGDGTTKKNNNNNNKHHPQPKPRMHDDNDQDDDSSDDHHENNNNNNDDDDVDIPLPRFISATPPPPPVGESYASLSLQQAIAAGAMGGRRQTMPELKVALKEQEAANQQQLLQQQQQEQQEQQQQQQQQQQEEVKEKAGTAASTIDPLNRLTQRVQQQHSGGAESPTNNGGRRTSPRSEKKSASPTAAAAASPGRRSPQQPKPSTPTSPRANNSRSSPTATQLAVRHPTTNRVITVANSKVVRTAGSEEAYLQQQSTNGGRATPPQNADVKMLCTDYLRTVGHCSKGAACGFVHANGVVAVPWDPIPLGEGETRLDGVSTHRPGWKFQAYNPERTRFHASIPSQDVLQTEGSVRYAAQFNQYGPSGTYNYTLCKDFISVASAGCALGAKCPAIHYRPPADGTAASSSSPLLGSVNRTSSVSSLTGVSGLARVASSTSSLSRELCEEVAAATASATAMDDPKPIPPPNPANIDIEVHTNYHYRTLEEIVYPTLSEDMLPPGTRLKVHDPNQRHLYREYPPRSVLVTQGARDFTANPTLRAKLYHCAHFYLKKMCNRGPQCKFIHAATVDPKGRNPTRCPASPTTTAAPATATTESPQKNNKKKSSVSSDSSNPRQPAGGPALDASTSSLEQQPQNLLSPAMQLGRPAAGSPHPNTSPRASPTTPTWRNDPYSTDSCFVYVNRSPRASPQI